MTRESTIRSMSAVTEPSNAIFVIGRGAICDSSLVQRWKMLLPTKTMPPVACPERSSAGRVACWALSAGAARAAASASATNARCLTASATLCRGARRIVRHEHADPAILSRRNEQLPLLAASDVQIGATDRRAHRLVHQFL